MIGPGAFPCAVPRFLRYKLHQMIRPCIKMTFSKTSFYKVIRPLPHIMLIKLLITMGNIGLFVKICNNYLTFYVENQKNFKKCMFFSFWHKCIWDNLNFQFSFYRFLPLSLKNVHQYLILQLLIGEWARFVILYKFNSVILFLSIKLLINYYSFI